MHFQGSKTALCLALILICVPSATVRADDKDANAKAVDALFATWDKPDSPGCALGVIKDGKLIYARGYGAANLEHDIRITTKSVFDIGSTSKQFTAASIALLAAQGKLSIDDDIRRFIPELPDYGKKITLRNLLNHTSGIRDYLGLMSLVGINFDDTTSDDDALRLIVRQKALNFDPGEEHLYSNSGYFLLSIIVKRASGKSLRQFAEENIFGPLGMKHTHYHDDHTLIVPLRAQAYAPKRGGGFRIDMSNFEQTGDGAVMTTVEDLLLWDQNFYDAKVGGRAMYDQLLTQGVLNNGKKLSYAEGLVVEDYKGLKLISHGGAWAGYRAELIRFPEQKFSVICLSNLATFNPSRLARQVADVYLADQFKPPAQSAQSQPPNRSEAPERKDPIKLTSVQLAEYAGNYYSEELDVTYEMFVDGEHLILRIAGRPQSQSMTIARKDGFAVPGVSVNFSRAEQGRISGFSLNAGRVKGILFVKK